MQPGHGNVLRFARSLDMIQTIVRSSQPPETRVKRVGCFEQRALNFGLVKLVV